jgi:hypothetical protein
MVRRRLLNTRTTIAIGGITRKAISVSFQLEVRRIVTSATMVTVSRTRRHEHARPAGGDVVDVVGELRHELRRGVLVEVGGRQAQHLREHLAAQVQDHLVADPLRGIARGEARKPAHDEDGDDREREG